MKTSLRVIFHLVISCIILYETLKARKNAIDFNKRTENDMEYDKEYVPSYPWCITILILVNILMFMITEFMSKI